MTSPRVLVLAHNDFARSTMVQMLQRLGIKDIVQSSDPDHAFVQVHLQGGVDIVLCNLMNRELDCLEFLSAVGQNALARSVAICGELQPELHRTLGQMISLAGLELLGVLRDPVQLKPLRRIFHRYQLTRMSPESVMRPKTLPSEDEVHRGLALGEFRAWFQPQVQLCSNDVVAIEALVRWEHPARGVMLPADFLGAVLAYDLIDQMFKQLLDQGLRLLGGLRHQGINLTLAFNLHASQLANGTLVDHIEQTIEHSGFQGSILTFELAENGLLACTPDIRESLVRLRSMGCGLSIDDFGLGFSSFKSLCQLPFNQIKLHGKFVQYLSHPCNRAMVRSAKALVHSLGMSLVIEGISSQQILDGVLALDCETGQGFHLARPMTGRDLLHWLNEVSIVN